MDRTCHKVTLTLCLRLADHVPSLQRLPEISHVYRPAGLGSASRLKYLKFLNEDNVGKRSILIIRILWVHVSVVHVRADKSHKTVLIGGRRLNVFVK